MWVHLESHDRLVLLSDSVQEEILDETDEYIDIHNK